MKTTKRLSSAIVARCVADVIIVNVGLLIGLIGRIVGLAVYSTELSGPLEFQVRTSVTVYERTALILTAVCLVVFAMTGFYTKGRYYAGRYKAMVIAQATTLAYLIFGLIIYITPALSRFPRSTLGLAWIATALLLIWARFWSSIWRTVVRSEDDKSHTVEPGSAKHVLVIGGAGYIGSVLTRELLSRGYRVRVLDLLLYTDASIRDLKQNDAFEFVHGDSRDIEAVVKALAGVEAVVHLGEIVGDPATDLDARLTQEINVTATRMVAEVAKGFGIKRFVYASSCSVYGASDGLMTERSVINPLSVYAKAKVDAERIFLEMNDERFHPTILRLATVYGLSPRARFDLVVNVLTAKAVVEHSIPIYGGSQWRPFVHVRDVARCIIATLESPSAVVKGQVFNVGSDQQNYTIGQVGAIIKTQIPTAQLVEHQSNADLRNYRVSFGKVANELGFAPTTSLIEGIQELEEALRSGRLGSYTQPKYSNYLTLRESDELTNLIGKPRATLNLVERSRAANLTV